MGSYKGDDDHFRDRERPMDATNTEPRDPICTTLIKAAGEVGIAYNPNYNGAK